MRKIILTTFCGLFMFVSPFAFSQTQTGNLQGKITTSDGAPAEYINVVLKNTGKGTLTTSTGSFLIEEVNAGNYTLVVSFVGLESQELPVEVKAGITTTVPKIQLKESSQQMQEVVIKGIKDNPFAEKESEYVARLPIENLENPQVYSVITNTLMQEQQVTDLNGALQNAPGVNNVVEGLGSGGVGMNVNMRGFSSEVAMRNGMATTYVTMSDPVNLERIEVIKGPSATLFGSTLISYGGLINRVTKQPLEKQQGEVSFATGSFGLGRLTADFNTPLNKAKTALLRVNAVNHWENSFLDHGRTHTWGIMPNLLYKVSSRLTLNVEAEILNTKRPSAFWGVRGVTATNFNELNYDFDRSFISDDLQSEAKVFNVFARASYKISDQWTSQTNYSYAYTDNHANYMFLNFINDSDVQRMVMEIPSNFNSTQIQQNFIGDFQIGSMRNRLLVGLDFYYLNTSDRRTRLVYDTVSYEQPNIDFSVANYQNLLGQTSPFLSYTRLNKTYSAYASDVINLTERFTAMLSLRVDHFSSDEDDFSQTAVSPKLGLVYQVVSKQVSLFANYMDGFKNVAPDVSDADNVVNFKPEHATQIEGGIKTSIWGGRLNSTISYYDITVRDVVRTVPNENIGGFNSVQDGTQKSKGFEIELIANPLPGLNVVGGYGYNDSEYTKASEDVQGNRPYSTPEHAVNFWTSYKAVQGSLTGLGLGFGGNYVSDAFYDDANTFNIPAHTVLNASIFYEKPQYRIGLKWNNLTNEEYWASSYWAQPQKTRNFVATFTYKF